MARPKRGEPGWEEANAKMKRTMIEKYGGQEGYHKRMQEIGRKGGKVKGVKGFALDPERAITAGRKGGRISRRYGSRQDARLNKEKQKIIEMLNEGQSKKEVADWLDVSYTTFSRWALKNLKLEVVYQDEVDEEKNS